jgi:hypothetical protein
MGLDRLRECRLDVDATDLDAARTQDMPPGGSLAVGGDTDLDLMKHAAIQSHASLRV